MGSWNKTCGLSGLHIYCGSPVYVFLLEQNTDPKDRCYTTALWSPLLLPFESTYDDYGGGEKSHGMINYVLEGLKRCLVEQALGENPSHDIEVTVAGMDESLLFDSSREGRLYIKRGHEVRQADLVMFRKDVVDDILANLKLTQYIGSKSGGPKYVEYTFTDVLADVPAFIDEALKIDFSNGIRLYTQKLDGIFEFNSPNKVACYMTREGYRYSRVVDISTLIFSLLHEGKRAEAEAVLIEHVRAAFLDAYMDSIRKIWAPGCFEGSQTADDHARRVLCSTIVAILDKEKALYGYDE